MGGEEKRGKGGGIKGEGEGTEEREWERKGGGRLLHGFGGWTRLLHLFFIRNRTYVIIDTVFLTKTVECRP